MRQQRVQRSKLPVQPNTLWRVAIWFGTIGAFAHLTVCNKIQTDSAPMSEKLGVGFPDGVMNTVTGFGSEIGAALVEHPQVRS
jgi:Aldehyde dehydrogenase family